MSEPGLTRGGAECCAELGPGQYAGYRGSATKPPISGKRCRRRATGTCVCIAGRSVSLGSDNKYDFRWRWISWWRGDGIGTASAAIRYRPVAA